jgi:hypothetical protein
MTPAVPAAVETSYRLWLATIATGVLSGFAAFFVLDELVAASGGEPLPELPPGEARTATLLSGVFALLVTAAFVALALLVVNRMRAGRRWARLVLTLLGGLTVVYGLLGLGDTLVLFGAGLAGVLFALLSVLQLVLLVGAIVFMYRPDAGAYFSRPTGPPTSGA